MAFKKKMQIGDWIGLLLRWKWLLAFSLLIGMFIASVYCVIAKELYKSSTTILVIPQEIPEDYVKSTVTYSIEERLNTLQQEVLSRTRLMNIIQNVGLNDDPQEKGSSETLVEEMRERINIEIKGGKSWRDKKNSFTIEYSDEDPRTAMIVTSGLASMFIDKNLRIREAQAEGTAVFLKDHLGTVKKELEKKDKKIKEYRTRYIGELPEQLNSNLGMLNRYQDALKTSADSIRSAEDRLLLIETQISEVEAGSGIFQHEGDNEGKRNPRQSTKDMTLEEIIAEKRSELSNLLLKFTDNHPSVKSLSGEIATLESVLKDRAEGGDVNRKTETSFYVSPQSVKKNKQLEDLLRNRKKVELEIKSLKEEKNEIIDLLALYSKRVENTPKREMELKELTRDYNNLKDTHEELLEKKMNADMSHDLEMQQKGEQFQIIDPAYLPTKPDKPDRGKILMMAFMLSISAGGMGMIVLEMSDKSMKTPAEFKEIFDIPVLISIPEIETDRGIREKFKKKVYLLGAFLLYFIAVIVFVYLYVEKIRVILSV